jgi:general secretion pathway protein H
VKNWQKNGFTLLELLIVISLIGLLAGLTVPRFAGVLTTIQTKSAVKKVAAMLRHARSQAVSKQQPHTVHFDLNSGQVTLGTTTASFATAHNALTESLDSTIIKTYQLPDKTTITKAVSQDGVSETEQFTITFYPAGNSSGGEIILSGKKGHIFHVEVDFISGICQIKGNK